MKLSDIVKTHPELDSTYVCDEDSTHRFKMRDVELKPFNNRLSAPMATVRFITKSGKFMGGQPKKNDFILCCPICHIPHIFGMDKSL